MINNSVTVNITVMRYRALIFLNVVVLLLFSSCKQAGETQLYTDYHILKTVNFSKINGVYDIVFLGDSITEMGSFDTVIPNSINLGITGDYIWCTCDVVQYAVKCCPKKLFLMTGINSLVDYSLEESKLQYKILVDFISSSLPKTQIILESILPHSDGIDLISELNTYIRQVAEEKGYKYLDLYSLYAVDGKMPLELTIDGLHLKAESYSIWYEALKEELR